MAIQTIEGIDLAYDDSGQGEPIVLLHGHPFNRTMWREQVAALCPAYRVIAPDFRGYGESSVVPGTAGMDDLARDVAGLLNALGLGPVVLGGLSMAGQVALEFVRLFPDRVRALILADTTAQAETAAGRRNRRALADRVTAEGMGGLAAETLPRLIPPATLAARPELGDRVMAMMLGTDPLGAAADSRGRAVRRDHVAALPGLTVPTLVIVGEQDEYTPIADAETLHRGIRGSRLVVIAGAGHLPNLERPAEFNAALLEFLRGLDR